jgi:hypothetical protein
VHLPIFSELLNSTTIFASDILFYLIRSLYGFSTFFDTTRSHISTTTNQSIKQAYDYCVALKNTSKT